ncbi:MAG: hypothetical protein QNJ12_21285 [Ilumatobacter sp.]|uniref:hypothetical protein n=1 Tax=Ilumatobacter sp. TaxID=1967498 RepID=UPI002636C492|nr:hypothetical protein [Ilumatobacter sp.]MDJ0771333.1 hypothetical protein [Ilumatobacter sp.]
MIVVIVVLAIAVVIAVIVGMRLRRRTDPVDSFRRQIDALGPEARRPVVDQVRRVDDDPDQTGPDAS